MPAQYPDHLDSPNVGQAEVNQRQINFHLFTLNFFEYLSTAATGENFIRSVQALYRANDLRTKNVIILDHQNTHVVQILGHSIHHFGIL